MQARHNNVAVKAHDERRCKAHTRATTKAEKQRLGQLKEGWKDEVAMGRSRGKGGGGDE